MTNYYGLQIKNTRIMWRQLNTSNCTRDSSDGDGNPIETRGDGDLFLPIVASQGRRVSKLHRYHQYRLVALRHIRVNGPRSFNAVEDTCN